MTETRAVAKRRPADPFAKSTANPKSNVAKSKAEARSPRNRGRPGSPEPGAWPWARGLGFGPPALGPRARRLGPGAGGPGPGAWAGRFLGLRGKHLLWAAGPGAQGPEAWPGGRGPGAGGLGRAVFRTSRQTFILRATHGCFWMLRQRLGVCGRHKDSMPSSEARL